MSNRIDHTDYDYLSRKRAIDALCEEFNFLQQFPIGRSCAGRDIPALRLGKSGEYAMIAAAFHGSERITSNILLRFVEELCSAIRDDATVAGLEARKAMFGKGVIFVPCVNPDGCEIARHGLAGCGAVGSMVSRICGGDYSHWNANLRGVDINHNFAAGWEQLHKRERAAGIYGPAPTRFGGYKAESEPETLALTGLCRTVRIRHVIALHTQGEVIYWSYGEKRPARSEKMAEILATSSGYTLETPEGLAEGGGFKDWFISEFDRPGFTVELGLGENPLPPDAMEPIYERVREMLMLAAVM